MSAGEISQEVRLTVDLGALVRNWKALSAREGAETSAVVKADGYGLGLEQVATALRAAGARTFFVAQAREGAALRRILGGGRDSGPVIYVFNGFTPAETELFAAHALRPVLCSPAQIKWMKAALPAFPENPPVGVHIESGINRQGVTMHELDMVRAEGFAGMDVTLVMSHMACADEPEHPMNPKQRGAFAGRAALLAPVAPGAKLSLAATGGTLLGERYHFDMTRPGVGIYGGLPFADAEPVVFLDAPILQLRRIQRGESVGYGATWTAERDSAIGVLPLGYGDGIFRPTKGLKVWIDGRPAPAVGRISMDMITVDLTDHPRAVTGRYVEVLGRHQTIDDLAAGAGTIGYEVLTALGGRYARRYTGADALETDPAETSAGV